MKRPIALLLCASILGCAGAPPPIDPAHPAPPAPAASAPDTHERAAPPVTRDDRPPIRDEVKVSTLPNGMRIAVVERHGSPLVAARLVVATTAHASDPQAELRQTLAVNVFLAPSDSSFETSSWCGAEGCTVATRGASADLDELLGRVADLVRTEPSPAEAKRRYDRALSAYRGGPDQPTVRRRLKAAALFGYDSSYSPASVPPKPVELAALRAWRAGAFVPSAATLVLAGEVTAEAAASDAQRRFGSWSGPRAENRAPDPWPTLPDGPRVVLDPNAYWSTDSAVVVARGPAWNDPDLAPLLVALRLFDRPLPEAPPCTLRRTHLSTTRDVTRIVFLANGTLVEVGGDFDPASSIHALAPVLEGIRAARGGVTAEALERARRDAVAEWRRRQSDLAGAVEMADALLSSGSPSHDLALGERLAAVTADDVQRVVQRYFAEDTLRVVLAGTGAHFAGLQDLGLGGARVLDRYGRPSAMPTAR